MFTSQWSLLKYVLYGPIWFAVLNLICSCRVTLVLFDSISTFLKTNLSKLTIFHFITAYGNLGNILVEQGKKKEGELAYRKALRYRYNMADTHYNL